MLIEEKFKNEIEEMVKWVRECVEKAGAKGVVIGNSGGKDSATVIAIAVKAIGKQNVVTVCMPCFSNMADFEDAKLVSSTFDVPLLEINLDNVYSNLETEINKELANFNIAEEISKDAKVNVKPRLRMTTLYSIAQTMGYLVMGTGNLSEIMVGYTTKWGDSACDFNPIANFTMEEVKKIAYYLGVPEKIIEKSPNDGLGHGTDEEKMGVTYAQIFEYINTGKTEENAMKIIERMNRISKHKRAKIPTYNFDREKNENVLK